VSSFAEIARIPTEAIERMEVFPEELALKYGYRADQKVVNIITRERFSSRIGQLAYTVPTDGGRDTVGLNANYLHIAGDNRITLDAEYGRSSPLRESERTFLQPPGPPGSSRFRTLLPETRRIALNGAVSGDWTTSRDRSPKPKAEILAMWDQATKEIDEAWKQLPPGRFDETITAFGMYEGRTSDLIMYVIDNEIHHRGEGYVYLRSLGVEPPQFPDRS
jgi:hypothetical protein